MVTAWLKCHYLLILYFVTRSVSLHVHPLHTLTPSQTDVESDTEEDEYESETEVVELLPSDTSTRSTKRRSREARQSLEEDEMFDPHSAKFRAEGQLMSYEEDPSFEGYLTVKVLQGPLWAVVVCGTYAHAHCWGY